MRKNVSPLLFVLMLLTLSGMGLALVPPPPLANAFVTDVMFPASVDPICGIQVSVLGEKPVYFYTGTSNPWGSPSVIEAFAGMPNLGWWLTYGGANHPNFCYPRSYPRFWQGSTFLGARIGFYTTEPIIYLAAAGQNGILGFDELILQDGSTVQGPLLVGYSLNQQVLTASNYNGSPVHLGNVQIAFVPQEIAIEDLDRSDLDSLSWQAIHLDNNLVPAQSKSGQAGTLGITLPLSGQKGWAVVTYSVLDPKGIVTSTTTLEFPLK